MMGCVNFQLVIAKRDNIFNSRIFKSCLSLKKCMQFPLGVIFGEVLVLGPCGNNLDFLQDRYQRWHELLGAELNPTFSSVSYNKCLTVCDGKLKHFKCNNLKGPNLLHDACRNFLFGIECSSWIDERCAQNSVVPIKYNHCLIELRFVLGCEPHFVVCESGKEISSHLVRCSFCQLDFKFILFFLFEHSFTCFGDSCALRKLFHVAHSMNQLFI